MITKEFTINENEQVRGVLKTDFVETCLRLEKPAPEFRCVPSNGKYCFTVEWETELQWNDFRVHVEQLGYISLELN